MDTYDPKDGELLALRARLDRLVKETDRDMDAVAEAYVRVSGNLDKVTKYFNNPAIGWSEIEDLALAKPEDSPEFQILLSEKGWKEIDKRRNFLKATPLLSEITS